MAKKNVVEKEVEKVSKEISKKSARGFDIVIIAVVFLAIGFFLSAVFSGSLTGSCVAGALTANEAAAKAINYINNELLQEGVTASLLNVSEANGVYKIDIRISSSQGATSAISYVSKDGKLLFVNAVEIVESNQSQTNQQDQQTSEGYSEEELEKISTFINCLAEKGVKIYGANWCGYTKNFVQTLGGFEVAAPIYVECTENEELCSQEGISGYPTTKINGELYEGARTFEGLSEVTECPAPEVGSSGTGSGGGSCG